MIYKRDDAAKDAAMHVARQMVAAAVTAPKGCGIDNIEAVIVDGEDKDILAKHMRDIAAETGADFFNRDAGNVDNSYCVVLIGANNAPIELDDCSLCGFENCGRTIEAGANCAFNIVDLGIAIGSAVSLAADNRIDNRVLFSAGKAALLMNLFSDNVSVVFGIPLSVTSKSVFFDRDPGNVLF